MLWWVLPQEESGKGTGWLALLYAWDYRLYILYTEYKGVGDGKKTACWQSSVIGGTNHNRKSQVKDLDTSMCIRDNYKEAQLCLKMGECIFKLHSQILEYHVAIKNMVYSKFLMTEEDSSDLKLSEKYRTQNSLYSLTSAMLKKKICLEKGQRKYSKMGGGL